MTLYYKEYGDKEAPLMLFLHGGGVSGWMWRQQIQYFAHYHCIVPDLPGHGQSTHEEPFSIKSSANQLLALIEEKAHEKEVIILGFSLGAQIAIQMLSLKPDLIDFAIINSALVRPIPFAKKIINPSIKLFYPLIKNRSFSKLQAKTLYISKDDFEQYFQESRQMKLETLVSIMEENMSFQIPKHFENAKGKILVTVGEKERVMMKISAIDLVKNNPNCKGVILSKIGHGVSLAKPDLFNQMVEAWVNEGKMPDGREIGLEPMS
ncbi:alpha/beta hydrolase [Bacillus sp. JJ1503]|uniref:alpha/beta fold hydrolase n=1 Tax=Bacillus sp. JJ1503 TaxID=3122956 RepID=UPI002FFEE9AD